MVGESPRQIPVAWDVDVVVVGGSTGAVAAAVSAAEAGAKVFLAAPRHYLGEDMCATMRLWLEEGEKPVAPLAVRIFSDKPEPAASIQADPNALPFRYEADLPSAGVHKDTSPPRRLTDGILGPAESQSVQYDGDVTIIADLGSVQPVKEARVVLFHRDGGDFNARSVKVDVSDDRKTWKAVGEFECNGRGAASYQVTAPIGASIRYARFLVRRAEGANRVLLGEIMLIRSDAVAALRPATAPAADKPFRGPVRPMHVKKTLDDALLAAKVPFLYGCYATDVLRDADGKVCGIVMSNRAGRQAIRARVIIDATPRATVARLAGAQFAPYPAGMHTFTRVVVGGEIKSGENIVARKIDVAFPDVPAGPRGGAGGPGHIVEYTLRLPMADGSFASFAKAEQMARDLTWSDTILYNTDELFQIPPDPVKAVRPAGEGATLDKIDIGAFRPLGVERLYVLGGCADMPRALAAKMLRPPAYIETGARVGAAAAAEAAGITIKQAVVAGPKPEKVPNGDVKEMLAGVRPFQRGLPTVESPQRGVPILGEYDVVVVGGGTGGAAAGIGAARNKSRTLVIEYLNALGGVGTTGLISSYYWGYRGGFTGEMPFKGSWNPLHKAEWLRKTLREAGGEIWFGALGCGAFVDYGQVKGVVVATPDGRGVVLAKVVIDATGNSDIAAAAGAQTMHTDSSEMAQQGTGLPPMRLGPGYTNTDFTIVDETDLLDMWHVFVYAKHKYPDAFDLGQLLDTRERRRIVGDFVMTLPDQINNRTYPDTIAIAYSNFDTHGYTVDPYLLVEHPEKKGVTVNVPYRCLLPKGLDGILVTGLSISVHRDAVPLTRMQADIQNHSYAAGLIAATAAKNNLNLREVDIRAIQKELVRLGIIPEKALTETDSYPLPPEKIAQAVASAKDGHGMAVIITHPKESLPLLREAYARAAGKDKLTYAQILAVMGDATGIDTLIQAVEASEWDKGWNYTGMGQFGSSLSRLDTIIVALGHTRDKRAVPAIVKKGLQLEAKHEFSHYRAVAIALEMIGDPSAAGPLAEMLAKPGIRGWVHDTVEKAARLSGRNPNDNTTRATSIRELNLARALFRCGDKDGLGRAILEEYTRDLRGHLARHARAVLDQGARK